MTSDKDKSMRGGTQTGSSAQTGPYRGRIGDLDLLFASEEDFLKADRVWRETMRRERSRRITERRGSTASTAELGGGVPRHPERKVGKA